MIDKTGEPLEVNVIAADGTTAACEPGTPDTREGVPSMDEIVARIAERKEADMFGFEWQEYIEWLDHPHAVATGVLNEKAKIAANWPPPESELTREVMLAKMLAYMEFAWGKANDCRGISAGRSISHYVAWIWLAGDRAFSSEVEQIEHRYYGKPALVAICERYEWDWKKWDDDRWTDSEDGDGCDASVVLGRKE